ncbi:MAG: toast rack family protein [Anaerolineales bacterium]
MNVKVVSAILVLALASMACGFSVNLPKESQPGPEVKDSISVAGKGSEEMRLTLSFGAGRLKLSPGAGDQLVDGTAVYNFEQLKPEIVKDGNSVEIKHDNFNSLVNPKDIINEWDLKLGKSPIDLTINAGAYSGTYELGGLSITNLTVKDGAANVDLSFSKPNPIEMSVLRYETGASDVKLAGLANANFSTLMFNGGAGNYTLDFSGTLTRDGVVKIEAGAGDVHLIIPKGVNAKVTMEGALASVNHSSGWTENGGEYTQNGKGPELTIIVKMAAGSLAITD